MALTEEPLYSEPRSQHGEWGGLMKKIVLAAFIGILGISPLAAEDDLARAVAEDYDADGEAALVQHKPSKIPELVQE